MSDASVSNNMVADSAVASDLGSTIVLRSAYLQDRQKLLWLVLLLQLVLATLLGLFVFWQITTLPKPLLFPVTVNKQVTVPQALSKATMSNAALLNWAIEAVQVTYSFNYRSIVNHLSKISTYFDQRGMQKFFEMVANDDDMKLVVADKLIVSIRAKEAPKIVKEGLIEGRYAWRVVLPVEIRYENALTLRRQDAEINLFIWRVSELESPMGIKITNFISEVKRRSAPQAIKNNF